MQERTVETLLIATGNHSKFEEMGEEFRELGLSVTLPEREGFELTRPESGRTYHENARIKAEEGFEKSQLPSLADDSGLEVDHLDGSPGVKSDRWLGADASATEKNRALLEKLDGVPTSRRTARFICTMVLFTEKGEHLKSTGTCEGRIAEEPRGTGGFGYDPVFEVEDADWQTFAEVDATVKNWISHRALALNELISRMKSEGLLPQRNPSKG